MYYLVEREREKEKEREGEGERRTEREEKEGGREKGKEGKPAYILSVVT